MSNNEKYKTLAKIWAEIDKDQLPLRLEEEEAAHRYFLIGRMPDGRYSLQIEYANGAKNYLR